MISHRGVLPTVPILCLIILGAFGLASASQQAGRSLLQATPSPSPAGSTYTRACWRKSSGRGVGVVPSVCAAGLQQAGAFCYPPCNAGYTAFVASCFSVCPAGYNDDGALCTRPPHIYGKGCCCTIFGCCRNCPAGYNDDGCTCHRYMHTIAKTSYTRPTYELGCLPGKEFQAGLCYNACPSGAVGVGPVCYNNAAPTGYPLKCGENAWAKDTAACTALQQEEAALGIRIGVGAGVCLSAIVLSIASAGLLSAIPAAICPVAATIAAGAAENAVRLGAYPSCP